MLKHKSDDLVVKIDKGIQIIIRSLFFLYWAIDNYLILNKNLAIDLLDLSAYK